MQRSPFSAMLIWHAVFAGIILGGLGYSVYETASRAPAPGDAVGKVRGKSEAVDVQLAVDELRDKLLAQLKETQKRHEQLQKELGEAKQELVVEQTLRKSREEQIRLHVRLEQMETDYRRQIRKLQQQLAVADMEHESELDRLKDALEAEREKAVLLEQELLVLRDSLHEKEQKIDVMSQRIQQFEERESIRRADMQWREKNVDAFFLKHPEQFRRWTSRDGKYHTMAKFIKYDDDGRRVYLRKANGRYIWVDVDDLSASDHAYIVRRVLPVQLGRLR